MYCLRKYLLVLIIFYFIAPLSYGKGRSGYYIIKGVMYVKGTNTPLANSKIIINDTIVYTDKDGNYECKINWIGADRRGSIFQIRKKYNPKWIVFIYDDRKTKIKNEWKKFANIRSVNEDELTLNIYIYI